TRLGTLKALMRRGFKPEVVIKVLLEMGLNISESTIKWENLYAYNRETIDWETERYYFVSNPFKMMVREAPDSVEAKLFRHPSRPELGSRTIVVKSSEGKVDLMISSEDVKEQVLGSKLRLMSLFNVEVEKITLGERKIEAVFKGLEVPKKSEGIKLIQWILPSDAVKVTVLMPDASFMEGLGEAPLMNLSPDRIIQLVRFGFCRVERTSKSAVELIFSHP
ncbi:MAG: hypothetical protein ACUVQY_00005, partial [Thermoproteota archaeon]